MPRPSKRASQAKTQRAGGDSSFTKNIYSDSASEWENDGNSEDDSDSDNAKSRLCNLYSLFLPKHLQSVPVDQHQVW
jgi:hypothetical protein